jgi:hypothetical protein
LCPVLADLGTQPEGLCIVILGRLEYWTRCNIFVVGNGIRLLRLAAATASQQPSVSDEWLVPQAASLGLASWSTVYDDKKLLQQCGQPQAVLSQAVMHSLPDRVHVSQQLKPDSFQVGAQFAAYVEPAASLSSFYCKAGSDLQPRGAHLCCQNEGCHVGKLRIQPILLQCTTTHR